MQELLRDSITEELKDGNIQLTSIRAGLEAGDVVGWVGRGLDGVELGADEGAGRTDWGFGPKWCRWHWDGHPSILTPYPNIILPYPSLLAPRSHQRSRPVAHPSGHVSVKKAKGKEKKIEEGIE